MHGPEGGKAYHVRSFFLIEFLRFGSRSTNAVQHDRSQDGGLLSVSISIAVNATEKCLAEGINERQGGCPLLLETPILNH
jgi:hypothetical protein